MTIPFQPFDEDDRPEADDVGDFDEFDDLPDATTPDDSVDGDDSAGGVDAGDTGTLDHGDDTEPGDAISDEDRAAFLAAVAAAGAGGAGGAARPAKPNHPVAEGDATALGTARTLSKAEAAGGSSPSKGSKGPKGPKPSRGRRRPMLGLTAIVLAAVALAALPLLRSTFQRTPRDRFGISYGGGPIEGVHFQKIVKPGSGLFFNGIFDSLYLYPADQLNYILATSTGEDGKPTGEAVVAPTADRVAVSYQVAVYFKLNTDELRAFHEELGLRYQAFTDSGWDALMRDTLRQQIEASLQEETRRHPVADLYGNAELLVKVQQEIQVTLSERLESTLGGRYFCSPNFKPGGECGDPTFVIKRTDIPKAVADAFESNRTSEVLIATKENEVRQREQEAQGIAALSAALQESGPAYVLLKAIESGQIKFWVLPDDGSVNLTAPAAPDAAPDTAAAG